MRYNYYGMGEFIRNCASLVYTKVFFRKARLIRLPVYIRQKHKLKYGKGFTVGYNSRIDMVGDEIGDKLILGENCIIGDNCQISAGKMIKIGNNLLMARNVYISDISHGQYNIGDESSPEVPPNDRPLTMKEINYWR